MKQLLIAFFLFQIGVALPVGNPASPALYQPDLVCNDPCNLFTWRENFSLRIGWYGDYVYNRNLYVQDGVPVGKNIKDYTSSITAGTFTINIANYIQIVSILGTNTSRMFLNGGAFSNSLTMLDMIFDTAFTWGVAAQGILWNKDHLFLGVGMQYQEHRPRLKKVMRHDTADIMHFVSNNPSTYTDWQVSLSVAYTIENMFCVLSPYIGVKASGGNFHFGNFEFTFQGTQNVYILKTLEPRKLWGYATGVEIVVDKRVGVGVEARFADEKALSIDGTIRF